MWRLYFTDRNYNLLYLHVFGNSIATKLIGLFSGAFLYSLGLPLPLVILFFGLEFGLRGVIAAMAPAIVSKIGMRQALAFSYVFLLLFFVCIGLGQVSLAIGFFSFIFQSLSHGIYHPCADTIHSVLVKDGSRGRELTLEVALGTIAGLLAVAVGSSALAHAFLPAILVLVGVLALAILPLFFMDKFELSISGRFADAYRYLAAAEFRENLLPLAGYALVIIANLIVAPLFIFVLVERPATFSLVIVASLFIQLLFTLFYGAWIDRLGNKKTLASASFLQSLGNFSYLFVAKSSAFLPFLIGFNHTAWSMYSSNYSTRLQQKAKKSRKPLLFNTATQMNLCFVEVLVLGGFALIAWQWGALVFSVVFLCSILGLYVSTKYFAD